MLNTEYNQHLLGAKKLHILFFYRTLKTLALFLHMIKILLTHFIINFRAGQSEDGFYTYLGKQQIYDQRQQPSSKVEG